MHNCTRMVCLSSNIFCYRDSLFRGPRSEVSIRVITVIIITILMETRLNLEESREALHTGYYHQERELKNILGQQSWCKLLWHRSQFSKFWSYDFRSLLLLETAVQILLQCLMHVLAVMRNTGTSLDSLINLSYWEVI